MTFHETIDFAPMMEPVALALLGRPNERLSKPPHDIRFGNNGSMAVNYEGATWYDHENKIRGGVLDLVARKKGRSGADAVAWLKEAGIHHSATTPYSTPPRSTSAASRTFGKI